MVRKYKRKTEQVRHSVEDLNAVLRDIRPHQQAPPRNESAKGRNRGKTTLLTSDTSFEQIRSEKEARDAKQSAIEQRKLAATAKKRPLL